MSFQWRFFFFLLWIIMAVIDYNRKGENAKLSIWPSPHLILFALIGSFHWRTVWCVWRGSSLSPKSSKKESKGSSGSSYQAGLKRWTGESRKDGEQSRLPLLIQDLEKTKPDSPTQGQKHISIVISKSGEGRGNIAKKDMQMAGERVLSSLIFLLNPNRSHL